ncbi:MAG: hypothetical protein ABW032_08900, partial [Burkholderiaceae bacterium]
WTVWGYAFSLSKESKFRLDWKFIVAVIGGTLASWELVSTTNLVSTLLVCLPTWILVAHLFYLRSVIKEH